MMMMMMMRMLVFWDTMQVSVHCRTQSMTRPRPAAALGCPGSIVPGRHKSLGHMAAPLGLAFGHQGSFKTGSALRLFLFPPRADRTHTADQASSTKGKLASPAAPIGRETAREAWPKLALVFHCHLLLLVLLVGLSLLPDWDLINRRFFTSCPRW